MRLPDLSEIDIGSSIAGVDGVLAPRRGGQKLVFPCSIGNHRYALKVMWIADATGGHRIPGRAGSPAHIRALREFRILQRCASTHLTAVGPIGPTVTTICGQHVLYFTEEWIDGLDLHRLLRSSGPLPLPDVATLGMDVADAISVLWTHRIVHRDIKPGNIMRRKPSGAFVLLDLGSALDLCEHQQETPGRSPGTRLYFPPERIGEGMPVDHRSDLFSLGIVLYEAVTGLHPFAHPAADEAEALSRLGWFKPLRPTTFRADMPLSCSAIIMRLLAKKPQNRYRSPIDVIDALRPYSDSSGETFH